MYLDIMQARMQMCPLSWWPRVIGTSTHRVATELVWQHGCKQSDCGSRIQDADTPATVVALDSSVQVLTEGPQSQGLKQWFW